MGPYDLTRLTEGLLGQVGIQGQIINDARNNQLAQQQAGLQSRMMEAQLSGLERAQMMQQRYDARIAEYLKNPTAEELQRIAAEFPEKAQELKGAWQVKDNAVRTADLRFFGSARAAIQNKQLDSAVRIFTQRRDAERAAGRDTTDLDYYISALSSKDPAKVKEVDGTLLALIAAGSDPEKFGSTFKDVGGEVQNDFTLAPGARRFRADGSLVAEAPFAPRPVTVSEGQTVVEYQPGGGGQASGGAGGGSPRGVRNNNLGNLRDGPFARSQPGYTGRDDSGFAIFETPEAGNAAQERLLSNNYLSKGFNTPRSIVNRYAPPSENSAASINNYAAYIARKLGIGPDDPVPPGQVGVLAQAMREFENGQTGGGGPRVIAQGGQKQREAPSGYTWSPDGSRLVPIPGGPADPAVAGGRNPSASRKAEADFRKEFNALPEVKLFNKARPQFEALRALATKANPTAADDIALIFAYMKTLDPDSVVRETEYATAQNAGGIPESVRNAFNKAKDGTRLTPQQRAEFAQTAMQSYIALRNAYNQQAENYRGYAQDNGVNPDRVARRYLTARQQQEELARRGRAAPRAPIPVKSPQQAQVMRRDGRLKPGDRIVTPDGRVGTVR